jgi:hypothetical protein
MKIELTDEQAQELSIALEEDRMREERNIAKEEGRQYDN